MTSLRSEVSLDRLFEPANVAVIGASRDPTKWGGRVIRYLLKHGFRGDILPVNPGADEIQGIRCHASVAALPPGVDLAIVALPAEQVLDAVRELGENDAAVAVVLTSGFAELGAAGQALQTELAAIARSTGLRVCGPNSVGVANFRVGMAAAATSAFDIDTILPGRLSVVSQSGAVGLGSVLTRAVDRGIGLSKLASMGNESELSSAEVVRYLAADPETEAIALFVEGVRDGRALAAAVEEAGAAGKPVALLKVGRSSEGAAAAATHTGQLAGAPEVFRGAMDAAGALWCSDLEDLLDKTLIRPGTLSGRTVPRVAVMSTSGGINTLAADTVGAHGMRIADLTLGTRAKLATQLPSFNPIANPLDVSGHVAPLMDVQYACLKALLEDPNVDLAVVVLTVIATYPELVEILAERPLPSGKLVAFVNTGGSIAGGVSRQLQERYGHPVFASLSACVAAISDMWAFGRRARTRSAAPADDADDGREPASGALAPIHASPPGPVADEVLWPLLDSLGLPCAPWAIVADADEAIRAACEIGFPVVLKAMTRTVQHKSDLDAVALDLRTDDAVRNGYARVQAALAAAGHGECALVVQKHVDGAMELLVGGRVDEQFGPVVTLGHGGIFANLLSQSVTRPAPVDRREAEEMVAALPGRELLQGYRNHSRRDVDALVGALVTASQLIARLAHEGLSFELDLNPLMLLPEGHGAVVADTLLEKVAE